VNMTAVPRTVLHLQYQAVRLPVGVLDTRVLGSYLPADAPLRLAVQRVLGSLDTTAGRLLADQTLQRRGTALRERAAALTSAAQLERDAQHRRGQAEEQLTAAAGDASGRRAQARREHRDDVEQAIGDEQAAKRRVAEQAHTRAEAQEEQAQKAAAERLRGVDAQRSAKQTRIDAQQRQAAAEPTATLQAAAADRSDADKRRSDADRLNQLAAAESRQRRRA
jgi:hypothetical protein